MDIDVSVWYCVRTNARIKQSEGGEIEPVASDEPEAAELTEAKETGVETVDVPVDFGVHVFDSTSKEANL